MWQTTLCRYVRRNGRQGCSYGYRTCTVAATLHTLHICMCILYVHMSLGAEEEHWTGSSGGQNGGSLRKTGRGCDERQRGCARGSESAKRQCEWELERAGGGGDEGGEEDDDEEGWNMELAVQDKAQGVSRALIPAGKLEASRRTGRRSPVTNKTKRKREPTLNRALSQLAFSCSYGFLLRHKVGVKMERGDGERERGKRACSFYLKHPH